MQGTHLLLPILIPGSLTVNAEYVFKAPFDMQLTRVSGDCYPDTSFILNIGEEDVDEDAYLSGGIVLGADNAGPTEFAESDFVNGRHPHITQGTNVIVTIDYDGGAGDPASDVSLLLTFSEG